MFRTKGPVIFGVLARCLLCLLQDLASVSRKLAHSQFIKDSVKWPVVMNQFMVVSSPTTAHLSPAPLQVSFAALEMLEVAAMKIATDIIQAMFYPKEVGTLWETSCTLVACGTPKVKAVSLTFLTKLVTSGGWPEEHSQDLFCVFLHILDALVMFDQPDLMLFQKEFEELSLRIFTFEEGAHLRFERVHLNMLMDRLHRLAMNGELEHLMAAELTAVLGHIFNFMLTSVPVGYESAQPIRRERVNAICKTLIKTIGTETQQEVNMQITIPYNSMSEYIRDGCVYFPFDLNHLY